jgi:MFS family permease
MVTMFCVTASLLYADQNLMAPNLTAIADSACRRPPPPLPPPACPAPAHPPLSAGFGFDESERDRYLGGYVAAAFYLVGAPAALLFGYLSDTVNRRNLLFAAVLLGERRGAAHTSRAAGSAGPHPTLPSLHPPP